MLTSCQVCLESRHAIHKRGIERYSKIFSGVDTFSYNLLILLKITKSYQVDFARQSSHIVDYYF